MGLKINKASSLSCLESNNEEQRELQSDTTGLLSEILKELKIMNLHLSILTENNITEREVE